MVLEMVPSKIEYNGNGNSLEPVEQADPKKVDVEEGACSGVTTTSSVRPLLLASLVVMLKLSIVAGLAALVWLYMGWMFLLQLAIVALVAYLAAGGGFRWLYVAFRTAPRDIRAISRFVGLQLQARGVERRNEGIADLFRKCVAKHPDKVCFVFEDTQWTFKEVEEYSNKVAHVFQDHGYCKGDVVALIMENRPEFVCLWLGLSKLGVITALINYNLRNNPLIHSLTVAGCRAAIFGSELTEAMKEVAGQLPPTLALYRWCSVSSNESTNLGEKNLTALLSDAPSSAPETNEKTGYHDRLVYIYTSGTTGLPKAAVITTSRFLNMSYGLTYMVRVHSDDIIYCPLPLYHSSGGVLGIGQSLTKGTTLVMRKKFSASGYWPDCRQYGCTVAQYIGEMCRYILAVPEKPEDKTHKVRLIFGNGLRPQIWSQFVERFNIPSVAEFYGATEGNANIVNIDNKVGAIGFISRIIPAVYPITLIRADQNTGEPIRNAKGLCQLCEAGEPGVFIGKIIPNNPSRAFHGYVDKQASEKKVVRDVFRKGDAAFLSGDVLVADELGYLYFKDRTGDTYRWKGENVSTSEVEAVISNFVKYRDAIVYGVEVRGMEGKAGMAAIMDEDRTLDMTTLAEGCQKNLPSYGRPLFIRALNKVDLTGTFKLKKKDLQEEGFNPSVIKDRIYYLTSKGNYELLTEQGYADIMSGKIRL